MILAPPDRSAQPAALRRLFLLLALCPLLPAADSMPAAIGLSLVLPVVLGGTSVVLAPVRTRLPAHLRLLLAVIVMAALTAGAGLALQALAPALHAAIQPALRLVPAAAFLLLLSSEEAPAPGLRPLWLAGGAALLLLATGAARQLLGGMGLQLALEAPGAFFLAAALLALLQAWDKRHERGIIDPPPAGSRRVRVTGKIQ